MTTSTPVKPSAIEHPAAVLSDLSAQLNELYAGLDKSQQEAFQSDFSRLNKRIANARKLAV